MVDIASALIRQPILQSNRHDICGRASKAAYEIVGGYHNRKTNITELVII
jgi:hypothetical protein